MRRRFDPTVWILTALAFLSLLAASAMVTAAPPQRFKLHDAQVERVFACRALVDAKALIDIAAGGDMERAQAAAAKAMQEDRCGTGTTLLTYTELAYRVERDGHLYSVYAARIGEAATVFVLLVDWTHEGAA